MADEGSEATSSIFHHLIHIKAGWFEEESEIGTASSLTFVATSVLPPPFLIIRIRRVESLSRSRIFINGKKLPSPKNKIFSDCIAYVTRPID